MSKPTDHPSVQGAASDAKRFKLREGGVIKPLFKEAPPEEPVPAHAKRFANPQDRKNLFYGLLAIMVALVILCLLELKQIRDAAEEKNLRSTTAEQGTNAPEQSK